MHYRTVAYIEQEKHNSHLSKARRTENEDKRLANACKSNLQMITLLCT